MDRLSERGLVSSCEDPAAGAVLFYLDKVGINITAVLAGLGVGGIAVALALQRPNFPIGGARMCTIFPGPMTANQD